MAPALPISQNGIRMTMPPMPAATWSLVSDEVNSPAAQKAAQQHTSPT